MSFGEVYVIKNRVNNKKYIGQTSKTAEHRWDQHVRSAYKLKCPHFHAAIIKWGALNFDIDEKYVCNSADELDKKEKELISQYRSFDKEFGYNIDLGGKVTRIVSIETKEKMRLKAKESWADISYKENHSIISKLKWQDQTYAVLQSKRKLRGRVLVTFPDGSTQEIQSISIFCNENGLSAKHASRVLCGKRKTTGGFKFEYIQEIDQKETI